MKRQPEKRQTGSKYRPISVSSSSQSSSSGSDEIVEISPHSQPQRRSKRNHKPSKTLLESLETIDEPHNRLSASSSSSRQSSAAKRPKILQKPVSSSETSLETASSYERTTSSKRLPRQSSTANEARRIKAYLKSHSRKPTDDRPGRKYTDLAEFAAPIPPLRSAERLQPNPLNMRSTHVPVVIPDIHDPWVERARDARAAEINRHEQLKTQRPLASTQSSQEVASALSRLRQPVALIQSSKEVISAQKRPIVLFQSSQEIAPALERSQRSRAPSKALLSSFETDEVSTSRTSKKKGDKPPNKEKQGGYQFMHSIYFNHCY